MYLERHKVRDDYFYEIGYCSELDKYLLAVTVTYVSWYNQYYIIDESEYNLWRNNVKKLDIIADECRKDNIHSKRFLYSERPEENTKEQLEFSFGEIAMKNQNPDFERI